MGKYMDMSVLQQIYSKIDDELSREVFNYRLMQNISRGEEKKWVAKLVHSNETISRFYTQLAECKDDIVIYGAGIRGQRLAIATPELKWKCFIDANSDRTEFNGIPIIEPQYFLSRYNGEVVVITSDLYATEMENLLKVNNVPKEKIFLYGVVLNKAMVEQYFDVPNFPYSDEEIFVDLGCYDAMTDVCLKKKIGSRLKKVIAFEPDPSRIETCKKI